MLENAHIWRVILAPYGRRRPTGARGHRPAPRGALRARGDAITTVVHFSETRQCYTIHRTDKQTNKDKDTQRKKERKERERGWALQGGWLLTSKVGAAQN